MLADDLTGKKFETSGLTEFRRALNEKSDPSEIRRAFMSDLEQMPELQNIFQARQDELDKDRKYFEVAGNLVALGQKLSGTSGGESNSVELTYLGAGEAQQSLTINDVELKASSRSLAYPNIFTDFRRSKKLLRGTSTDTDSSITPKIKFNSTERVWQIKIDGEFRNLIQIT